MFANCLKVTFLNELELICLYSLMVSGKKMKKEPKEKKKPYSVPQKEGVKEEEYRGLVVWVLWNNNLCRLFNAKSIFIQIFSSISNNSV